MCYIFNHICHSNFIRNSHASKERAFTISSPHILVDEFIKRLDSKNLVSTMTGSIFSSPIHIQGSSFPEERGFIENAIKANGKNPFTNENMTLDQLNQLEDDQKILTKIKKLKDAFLKSNEQHSEYSEIEKLLSERTYNHKPIQTITGPRAPMDASPDDLLAMQEAGANPQAFFQLSNLAATASSLERERALVGLGQYLQRG